MINYYSIQSEVVNEIMINKSKFITYLFPIPTLEAFEDRLTMIKKSHYKATHHCTAYIYGDDSLIQKAYDDGEPSGTAGYPMLDVLKKNDLTFVAAVVVRYFGGIKLGSGGLIRAYSHSVSEALAQATLTMNVPQIIYSVSIDYSQNDSILHFFDQSNFDITILDTQYTDRISYQIGIYPDQEGQIVRELINCLNGQLTLIQLEERQINLEKF